MRHIQLLREEAGAQVHTVPQDGVRAHLPGNGPQHSEDPGGVGAGELGNAQTKTCCGVRSWRSTIAGRRRGEGRHGGVDNGALTGEERPDGLGTDERHLMAGTGQSTGQGQQSPAVRRRTRRSTHHTHELPSDMGLLPRAPSVTAATPTTE